MKRELAFALEARSQFNCFSGRTRSSKSSPESVPIHRKNKQNKQRLRNDRVAKSVEEVRVNRRNKRIKTPIPVIDDVRESAPAAPAVAVDGGEESAVVSDVINGGDEAPAVEVAKRGSVEKVYVKRKKSKVQLDSGSPKRFTRSALVEKETEKKKKEENVEGLGTPSRKNLEMKMSKKIGLGRMPTNMRELLETGLLEGFRVSYNYVAKASKLQGVIKGVGILCSCSLCEGTKVISPSQFEMHACKLYRHAIKHIRLENGKSLLDVIEICKASALEPAEVALQTVIRSLPVKGPSMCIKCNGLIEGSSTENMLVCDSCVDKKQVEAEPGVATGGQLRSSKSALKTVRRARKFKFSGNKIKNSKILKRSPRSASAPRPIVSVTKCTSSQQKSGPKLTKKNLSLHSPVFKEGGLPDGTELTYVARGKKCLDGYKLGNAIFCSCCNTEISASQFEAHAGWASRRKPYDNIYMSNGVSLHDYAVSLKNAEDGRGSLSSNDDVCKVCGEGGDLLLCDGCPRSFHKECAEETSIPRGKWYCKICQNSIKYHGENANALAAGRIAGVNPIELNMTRCVRIIKHSENSDLCACVLCRRHDFTKCVFNDRTVIVCDQCEREYHIGCLRERNMADLKALPKGEWFCCNDCKRINLVLKNLLAHEPETLRDDMLTIVKERQKNDSNNSESETTLNPETKFVVLRGKNAPSEARKLLAQAVNIFHEGFDPIVDATSGRDFIPSMVYGRKIWSQDFAGMLCAILTVDSKVVTAGTLRVFGEDLAELPIVATSKCNQGKGYFQLLFTCIERLLSSLKVQKIVLPAAEEAKSIWTNKFGFETISPDQLNELRQSCSAMMTFQGTSMLQKEILQVQDGVADADAGDNGGLNPLME
ncbi:putative histone acetyltransferase chromatin regulator PHD family [Helianthus anomalus]